MQSCCGLQPGLQHKAVCAAQILFFVAFLFVTLHVWRLTHSPAATARIPLSIFLCLWITCALIITRNAYRQALQCALQAGSLLPDLSTYGVHFFMSGPAC